MKLPRRTGGRITTGASCEKNRGHDKDYLSIEVATDVKARVAKVNQTVSCHRSDPHPTAAPAGRATINIIKKLRTQG